MNRDAVIARVLDELEIPEHRPGFFDRLEANLPRRRSRLQWGMRIAAGVAIATAVLVAVTVSGVHRPRTATAAEVKAKVSGAISTARSVQGSFVYQFRDPQSGRLVTERFAFAMTARGDLRLSVPGTPLLTAYDASTDVERAVTRSESLGGGIFYLERRGLGPLGSQATNARVQTELAQVVRALLASGDIPVTEVTHDGRPAWHLDIAVRPNVIAADVDRFDVTVDRDTGVPVHIRALLRGVLRGELRITNLVLDGDLPPFTFEFPRGAEVARIDLGFRRVTLDDVAGITGYPPLVPQLLPDGFELTDVAVARSTEPSPSRMVVALSYRRGLESIVVTTRLRGDPAVTWQDPLTDEGVPVRRRPHTLPDGSPAEIVLDPRFTPHLWALTDTLVVTVSGDLTADQLISVAQSLR